MVLSEENVELADISPTVPWEAGPIRLLKSTTLRGCNIYHDATVIRQRVDFGRLAGFNTCEAGPAFTGRFVDRFLKLETFSPNDRMRKAFVERLGTATGVRFEEALFEAILAVEASMAFAMNQGARMDFAEFFHNGSRRFVDFVWQCGSPTISRSAARVGLAGFVELLPRTLYPHHTESMKTFASKLAALRKRATGRRWSDSAIALARAAKERDLPCEPFGGAYLRLGQGVAQQVIYAFNTEAALIKVSKSPRKRWVHDGYPETTVSTVPIHGSAAAVRAASAAIGIDVAGGNSRSPGIVAPREAVSGCIVEMNSRREFRMHAPPANGESSDAATVLDLVFPPGTAARVPIAVIAGEQGTSSVAQDLATILQGCGNAVGLVTSKGASVCGKPVESGSGRTGDAARFVLSDPRVETLVSTVSPRGIVQHGLHLDACDVATIMTPALPGGKRTFQSGVEVLLRAVSGMLVISSEDTDVINTVERFDPRRLILLAQRGENRATRRHLAAGGAAVVQAGQGKHERVELHHAGETLLSLPLAWTTRRRGMITARRAQALMFAVGLAFGLGLSPQAIQSAATLLSRHSQERQRSIGGDMH